MLDLVLYNCRLFGKDDSIDTIGIKSGRIVEFGNRFPDSCRKKIDLCGRMVLPGFIDAHTHLLDLGLSLIRLDLSASKSREEAIQATTDYAQKNVAGIVVGYGWDETDWGETDYITGRELDQVGKPVVLFRRDMHMATVNRKALELAKLVSPDGVVKEENLRKLDQLTAPDEQEKWKALYAASRRAASEGITTVRDISGPGVPQMLSGRKLPLRVFSTIYDREATTALAYPDNMWGIKIFLDGSVGSMSAGHEGWPGNNMKFSDEKLQAHLESFWKNGFQVAMHAIGENAVTQAVKALRQQRGILRNSIEHFELVDEGVLQEINHPTVISSQPNFLQWSQKGGLYANKLGPGWFGRDNPFRSILDNGITLAFGSDCMPIGPSYGIGLAVNSPHQSQRITVEEAVNAYTGGGAYLLHEEHMSGSLETGYRADLAVFDEDYLSDTGSIKGKKAFMTILEGTIVHESIQPDE